MEELKLINLTNKEYTTYPLRSYQSYQKEYRKCSYLAPFILLKISSRTLEIFKMTREVGVCWAILVYESFFGLKQAENVLYTKTSYLLTTCKNVNCKDKM